jgi:hypothetical protein
MKPLPSEPPAASLTFRIKVGQEWKPIPLAVFRGMRCEDAWLLLEGEQAVCEFREHGIPKGYICGTEKWVRHYKAKGFRAYSFKDAVEWIALNHADMLEAICPDCTKDLEIWFEGAALDRVTSPPRQEG